MRKAVLAALVVLSGVAAADDNPMKAGLWEMKTTKQIMDGKDMTAQMAGAQEKMAQAMANMPADQRQKIEAMIQSRGGGSLGTNGFRICVSPEMAAKKSPVIDKDGRCPPAKFQTNGNSASYEINCTQDGRTMVGKGSSTYSGNVIQSSMDMKTTDARGTHTMQTQSTMTYLGADCQGIKPADQMMKEAQSAAPAKQ